MDVEGIEDWTSTSLELLISQPAPKIRWATREDWDAYKDVIFGLFRDYRLNDLIQIMETQYQFRSSPRMYKERFRQWDLTKYNKRTATKRPVWQNKSQRANSKSVLLNRMYHRSSIIGKWRAIVPGSSEDDGVTQRRSPTAKQLQSFIKSPEPAKPITPDVHLWPELFMLSLQNYYCGKFESKEWFPCEDGAISRRNKYRNKSLNELSTVLGSAMALFAQQRYREAGLEVLNVSAMVEGLLKDESQSLIKAILLIVATLQCVPEVVTRIFRQVLEVGCLHFNEPHPLSAMFRSLVSMDMAQLSQLYKLGFEQRVELFGRVCGPAHAVTLIARDDNIVWSRRGSSRVNDLRILVEYCRRHRGADDYHTLKSRCTLAWALNVDSDAYDEARALARDIWLQSSKVMNGKDRTYIQAAALSALAYSLEQLGQIEEAGAHWVQRLDILRAQHGILSHEYCEALMRVEDFLALQGRDAVAGEYRALRLEIVTSITNSL